MIFLIFSIGADSYALEARKVVEVLPRAILKKVPQTPTGVAGVLDFYGAPVPVVDLSEMALGVPSQDSMSTRLMIVRYGEHLLGLLAESATETARLNAEDFVEPGVSSSPDASYLGPVAYLPAPGEKNRRMVQRVEIEKLLSDEVRERLWQPTQEPA